MRDKFLQLVEMIKTSTLEDENQEADDERLFGEILAENQYLREIAQLTRLSDPEFQELSEYFNKEEENINERVKKDEEGSYGKLNINLTENSDDFRLTQEVIEEFKRERNLRITAKKSESLESDESTKPSDDAMYLAGGQTPILINHQSPTNSTSSNSDKEENHIRFFNADSLTLTTANKENNDFSYFQKNSLSNSLAGLKSSLETSNLLIRNSLDNKIGADGDTLRI